MKINPHFQELEESYLFTEIARRAAEYERRHAGQKPIRLSIGDVTRPLCAAAVDAMRQAAAELGDPKTFRGYGPEQGYPFLREAVSAYYAQRGIPLSIDEIFISDGAKSDLGNILELFAQDAAALIPDPVYPAYVDANRMAGRPVAYLRGTPENGFCPIPQPGQRADVLYICSPNNPTGAVYTREKLEGIVRYAKSQGVVVLFDAAYEFFVDDASLPRSIFEIEGARECAIEFCSLSKTAGFTGTRCGYTIIPNALRSPGGTPLQKLWLRRQSTKFNGVPYIVQRGAQAVFSPQGLRQCRENAAYYKENAAALCRALDEADIRYVGGTNAPYIFMECPAGLSSWEFFDLLLEREGVVGTPGAGFGDAGEGRFRLSAFGSRGDTLEAASRLLRLIKNL